MLMSHVTGTTPAPQLLARIRAGQVGSVILYSENIDSDSQVRHLTATLQEAARAGGNPPLFIGTDQEGGSVKRLADAPPTLSARQMGASADPFTLARSQGHATGEHLRRLGINLDFAPVADIPTTANNFLQDRAFGRTQRSVLEGASGFAQGLAEARVAGSAKHFPGLGAAGTRDSDFTLVSIPATKSQLQSSYAPYLAMSELGSDVAPMVMISDASYPALDPSGTPAVLSQKIIHAQLAVAGMGGRLAITDDLEVPSIRQYSNAAVKAVLAGEDVLMFAQRESGSELAYAAIASAVRSRAVPSALVMQAAARVVKLKRRLGLQ
jgi:beta-N-acetylhexosaminidase